MFYYSFKHVRHLDWSVLRSRLRLPAARKDSDSLNFSCHPSSCIYAVLAMCLSGSSAFFFFILVWTLLPFLQFSCCSLGWASSRFSGISWKAEPTHLLPRASVLPAVCRVLFWRYLIFHYWRYFTGYRNWRVLLNRVTQ